MACTGQAARVGAVGAAMYPFNADGAAGMYPLKAPAGIHSILGKASAAAGAAAVYPLNVDGAAGVYPLKAPPGIHSTFCEASAAAGRSARLLRRQ